MIIKIDHIAYSMINFEEDINYFINLGYSKSFIENCIKNLDIKKNLLLNYSKTHKLAFLCKENNFNIEVTDHNSITKNQGFIQDLHKINNETILAEINTNSIKQSINFWNVLGFKTIEENNNSAKLEFASIFSKNTLILYLRYNNVNKKYLNDKGYNCIAFITNAIHRERLNLLNRGFKPTNINEIMINNKNLKILFVQNNDCEIVEIIEVSK